MSKDYEDSIQYSLDETSVGESVPDEWSVARIENITESSLYGLSESGQDYKDSLPRYIRVTDLRERRNKLKEDEPKSISEELAKDRKLESGDILFARSGASRGKTYLVEENTNMSYGGYLIRYRIMNNIVEPKYFLQYTKSDKYLDWVDRVARGGAQDNVSANEYNKCLIPVPPLAEQRRIASILYSVDEQLTVLHDRHDMLSRQKHGLLDDLFKPDNPKIKSEPIEEVTRYSNQGDKYDAYQEEKIPHIADINNGGTPDTSVDEYWGGKITWYRPKEMTSSNHPTHIDKSTTISRKGLENSPTKLIQEGNLSLTSRATVGQSKVLTEECAFNQGCYTLELNESTNPFYIHYAIQSRRDKLESIATGATFDSITKRELRIFDIPMRPINEQERIASILYTVDEMIARTSDLIDEYEHAKRGLMQDLLSGDVRTPEDLEVLEEIKSE